MTLIKRSIGRIFILLKINEVSWHQSKLATSLDLIIQSGIPKTAKIIDVGGGDSFLADHLLESGYTGITILDISEVSINKAKQRLGSKSEKVTWIVSDILKFDPVEKYHLWHDRAAFHFLTQEEEFEKYIDTVEKSVVEAGTLVIGTFSEEGPKKCSGIEIKQYSQAGLTERFKKHFEKTKCLTVDHSTPFNTTQNFVFCSFRRSKSS